MFKGKEDFIFSFLASSIFLVFAIFLNRMIKSTLLMVLVNIVLIIVFMGIIYSYQQQNKKKLLKSIEDINTIYVTDPSGNVEHTNEQTAEELNLYETYPSFLDLKGKENEYTFTPIKKRIEDGKLYKFLITSDIQGKLYQIGIEINNMMDS